MEILTLFYIFIMVMGECILIELYYSGNCWNVMGSKSIFKIYEIEQKSTSGTLQYANFYRPLLEATAKGFLNRLKE